jgi:hypothetical protein
MIHPLIARELVRAHLDDVRRGMRNVRRPPRGPRRERRRP